MVCAAQIPDVKGAIAANIIPAASRSTSLEDGSKRSEKLW
jgi:hypothetical protein